MDFRQFCDTQSQLNEILKTILELFAPILNEFNTAWPTSWTANLFAPPRQFDERRRARKFLTWLQKHGVPVDNYLAQMDNPQQEPIAPPTPFAGGTVGQSFPIGNFVVKLTTDKKEAGYANKMKGMDLPYAAKIYDVTEIPGTWGAGPADQNMYAIIMDRLNTGVGKRYRIAGDAVHTYLDENPNPLNDINKATNFTVANYLKPGYRKDQATINIIRQLFSSVRDMYTKTGIHYRDTQGSNLALKGRQPAFFDLGTSTTHGAKFDKPGNLY